MSRIDAKSGSQDDLVCLHLRTILTPIPTFSRSWVPPSSISQLSISLLSSPSSPFWSSSPCACHPLQGWLEAQGIRSLEIASIISISPLANNIIFIFVNNTNDIIFVFIINTRPKPPSGRQGLAVSWGKDTVRQVHYKMFSTSQVWNFSENSSILRRHSSLILGTDLKLASIRTDIFVTELNNTKYFIYFLD